MNREPKRAQSTRRSFLKAVGAAAAALPFYGLLEDNVVLADSGALPLRFVGVGAFHATTQLFWARQAGETDTTYDLSYADCALRPFDDAATYGYSFKSKLIICEGFDYGVGQTGPVTVPMHGALGLMLTASQATSGSGTAYNLQNASIDQVLAATLGGTTKFRSVEMCTEDDMADLESSYCIAYGAGGKPLSRMTSPAQLFDKFFASLVVPSGAAAQAAAAHKRAVSQSVLDFVNADIQRLQGRLAGAERQKLDQHLTVVRDLEKRLSSDPVIAAACKAPARHAESGNASASDDYVVANQNNGGQYYFDRIADWQMELLAEILICDLARFGTIVLPNTPGEAQQPTQVQALDGSGMVPGALGTDRPLPYDVHNGVAHLSSSASVDVQRAVASLSRYYYGKVAKLMQRLQDASILDSTLIMVGNEGGHGAAHSIQNVPLLLAGGAGGALKMGRRVVAPGRTAQVGAFPVGAARTSHAPILVAVANAFGQNVTSFGTASDPSLIAGAPGLF